MAVLFRGVGRVFIPEKNRFIRFVGGQYSTDDAAEIAVLARKYEHDAIEPTQETIKKKAGRPKKEPANE